MEDLIFVCLVFGTALTGIIAFSPIGRAIGAAIQKKSGVAPPGELAGAVDELAERVEVLQRQVGELAERQDFAERLLAQVRERGQLPAPGGAT